MSYSVSDERGYIELTLPTLLKRDGKEVNPVLNSWVAFERIYPLFVEDAFPFRCPAGVLCDGSEPSTPPK